MILPNFAKNFIKCEKTLGRGRPLGSAIDCIVWISFFGFWLQEEQLYMVVDFPDGGANLRVGPYANLLYGTIFTENCIL